MRATEKKNTSEKACNNERPLEKKIKSRMLLSSATRENRVLKKANTGKKR